MSSPIPLDVYRAYDDRMRTAGHFFGQFAFYRNGQARIIGYAKDKTSFPNIVIGAAHESSQAVLHARLPIISREPESIECVDDAALVPWVYGAGFLSALDPFRGQSATFLMRIMSLLSLAFLQNETHPHILNIIHPEGVPLWMNPKEFKMGNENLDALIVRSITHNHESDLGADEAHVSQIDRKAAIRFAYLYEETETPHTN